MSRWVRWSLVGVAVVAFGVALFTLPLDRWVLDVVGWARDAGPLGVLAFAGVYIVSTLLLIPGSLLTAGAGFAYGPVWGTLLVSPVSVIAATIAFLLGRTVASGWVERRVEASARFAAIEDAVGKHGLKIVLLLRLSPVFPFNLLNYGLGLTKVRLRDFVFASFVGMLPGTALYVYLGSLVTSASKLASGTASESTGRQVLYWVGLVATLVVTVLITRIARRALDRAIEESGEDPG